MYRIQLSAVNPFLKILFPVLSQFQYNARLATLLKNDQYEYKKYNTVNIMRNNTPINILLPYYAVSSPEEFLF